MDPHCQYAVWSSWVFTLLVLFTQHSGANKEPLMKTFYSLPATTGKAKNCLLSGI
jgi:hypothetical protein